MIRAAQAGDETEIEAFLAGHAETSMFLRANLARFGLFDRQEDHAMKYWLDEGSGQIAAVFARSNTGFVMLQAPDAGEDFWRGLRAVLAGQPVAGITGDAPQVARLRQVLGLNNEAYALDRPEPLYRLTLADMKTPEAGDLRPPVAADIPLLTRWYLAYQIEALGGEDGGSLRRHVKTRAEDAVSGGNVRLLFHHGAPMAVTGFNARLPDMVQLGGIYTPPDRRSRGFARKAVALHLAEVRAKGVKTAILFASGEPACRAYEAVGFRRIGEYALAILKQPARVGAI